MSDEKHVTRHELGLELKVYKGEIVDELKAMLDEKIDGLSARFDTANIDRRNAAIQDVTGFEWKDRAKARTTIQHFHGKMVDDADTKKTVKKSALNFTVTAAIAGIAGWVASHWDKG